MTVVVDTSAVLALMRADDEHHALAAEWFDVADEELVTSPLCIAELDHLVLTRGGRDAALALWRDLERGAYTVRWWADALDATIAVARRHPVLGLADASLVALAARVRTNRILTFDRRFRRLTDAAGDPFVLLPAAAHEAT